MPSLSVKKIQSTQEEGMYADGNNLYLRVKDNRKSWIFRYTLDSRRRDMGLGSAKVLSLAEARILSNEQKKLLLKTEHVLQEPGKDILELIFLVEVLMVKVLTKHGLKIQKRNIKIIFLDLK